MFVVSMIEGAVAVATLAMRGISYLFVRHVSELMHETEAALTIHSTPLGSFTYIVSISASWSTSLDWLLSASPSPDASHGGLSLPSG
jgi:hypothetical protein